ncbi:MAG: TonB-dependent receptor [Bacteroidia bacterium]|nr:TonB-dependent receptor [Bacteroidia bacterium]
MRVTLLFLILLFFVVAGAKAQEGKVSGIIVDTVSAQPVQKVTVSLNTLQTQTDEKGYFEFLKVPYGKWTIILQADGFETTSFPVDVNNPEVTIGNFTMKQKMLDEVDKTEGTISEQDLEVENKEQNISGPLHSASDVFISTVGFTLGAGGFKIRGYDSENELIYINSVPVNNAVTGRALWSEWGGLNDVTRNKDAVFTLVPSKFSFGNIGGATDIDARASHQRKETKISYALSNKTYTNRVMATYSTGMMSNGWAFTVSGSRRWGNGGYVDGTFYDGWSYFMGIEKKVTDNHSLGITVFAAPTKRGMQAPAVQEAYDLTGSNYYNPNWGYQNGEVRNAKVRSVNDPYIILNHYWDINKKTKITSSAGYSFGRFGTTALNWYNAQDPRPDYYRYLPSYQTDSAIAGIYTTAWQTDPSISQINWNKLYQINYLSNLSGEQARYIIEERRDDYNQLSLNSHINHELNERISISGGVELKNFTGSHYKTLNDLLGGEYWIDIDQFAERDFSADTVKLQNDLNNPNRIIKEGDKFGYDYNSHINTGHFWAQSVFTFQKVDIFAAASFTATQFWRTGNMKNGRYPDNSYGNSAKQNFNNFGVKGGATYKITGRHFVNIEAGYLTRAPFFKNAYMSPRIRDNIAPGIKSEELLSASVGYIVRYPRLQAGVTLYQTNFKNGSEINTFYHDVYQTYVNQALVGIDKIHRGIEFGSECKITKSLSAIIVAAVGQYYFTSRPTATISYDNGSVPDTTETIYLKNFNISGTPQIAGSVGLKYSHPKMWYASVNWNYFGDIYIDVNPERRTVTAIDGLGPGDPKILTIINQQRMTDQNTLDVSLGKSLKIKNYFININFNVSNVLDNQKLVTGGYEQMRFDFETKNVDKFPPKYFYAFGRTYYLGISFKF